METVFNQSIWGDPPYFRTRLFSSIRTRLVPKFIGGQAKGLDN